MQQSFSSIIVYSTLKSSHMTTGQRRPSKHAPFFIRRNAMQEVEIQVAPENK